PTRDGLVAQEKLFVWMLGNAQTATEFFRIPLDRVMQVGVQVELQDPSARYFARNTDTFSDPRHRACPGGATAYALRFFQGSSRA
ncbi:MAG: hypothetical protein JWM11_6286, partial [Planctomycetaceae bacterium]|nr:hypothetical protein [Planctomycetaceae bacterium]